MDEADAASTGDFEPLRLGDVLNLDPGHEPEERQPPEPLPST